MLLHFPLPGLDRPLGLGVHDPDTEGKYKKHFQHKRREGKINWFLNKKALIYLDN